MVVMGFLLGKYVFLVKVYEVVVVLVFGVSEIDMVIDIGVVLCGDIDVVCFDIEVVCVVVVGVVFKVIVELVVLLG